MFTRRRHILKTVKNVMAAQFWLVFTRYRQNLKTIENSTVTNSAQSSEEFDAKEMHLHHKSHLASFWKCWKMFRFHQFCVFIIFAFLLRCRFQNVGLEFRCQNLPFLKIYKQKMCRFRMNGRPINHMFHRFQNVTASCERNLSWHHFLPASHWGENQENESMRLDKFSLCTWSKPILSTLCRYRLRSHDTEFISY